MKTTSSSQAAGGAARPLGAHMSIAGDLALAVERANSIEATALQIFTKNQRRWHDKAQDPEAVLRFRQALEQSPIQYLCAHAGYLINLASVNLETREKAQSSLLDELERAEALGCDCLILHPGAPKEAGREQGIAWVVEGLQAVLENTTTKRTAIALENTAGQGTTLGITFTELGQIIAASGNHPRLQLCLDTCHAFAAGYDLRQAQVVSELAEEIETQIGLERLRVFHLNDSLKDCGSHIDRHEHIGQGKIGEIGFVNLLRHPQFRQIPGILETPKDAKTLAEDRINLTLLRKLCGESAGRHV